MVHEMNIFVLNIEAAEMQADRQTDRSTHSIDLPDRYMNDGRADQLTDQPHNTIIVHQCSSMIHAHTIVVYSFSSFRIFVYICCCCLVLQKWVTAG